MVRVGMKIPQDGNRANKYRHVAVMHEHVWRTLCSVCATGARVSRPVPRNWSFVVLEVFTGVHMSCICMYQGMYVVLEHINSMYFSKVHK